MFRSPSSDHCQLKETIFANIPGYPFELWDIFREARVDTTSFSRAADK